MCTVLGVDLLLCLSCVDPRELLQVGWVTAVLVPMPPAVQLFQRYCPERTACHLCGSVFCDTVCCWFFSFCLQQVFYVIVPGLELCILDCLKFIEILLPLLLSAGIKGVCYYACLWHSWGRQLLDILQKWFSFAVVLNCTFRRELRIFGANSQINRH